MELSKLQSVCKTKEGKKRCEIFAPLLKEIMPIWGINSHQRQAMFIAQVMHESGEFRYLGVWGAMERRTDLVRNFTLLF